MPNGHSVILEHQPGADVSGYAGLEDDVDHHWGVLSKAVALSTILSIGSEAGTSNSETISPKPSAKVPPKVSAKLASRWLAEP